MALEGFFNFLSKSVAAFGCRLETMLQPAADYHSILVVGFVGIHFGYIGALVFINTLIRL